MYPYIHKYFSIHKKLILPGIGTIEATTKTAQLDFVNKTLHAPLYEFYYKKEPNIVDDQFYHFLSKETGIDIKNAKEDFTSFTGDLKQKLRAGDTVQLEGIGNIRKIEDGYLFVKANGLGNFFPDVTAERVIRQNVQHAVKVGEQQKTSGEMLELLHKEEKREKWWIDAIVLAVIGIAAILYYYLSKKT